MIIAKLQGGLGNQMFQYAIARSLSNWYKTDFALDHQFLESRDPFATHVFRNYDLDLFTLTAPKATSAQVNCFFPRMFLTKELRELGVFPRYNVVLEPHYHFYSKVFCLSKNIYLDGYWQSQRYFEHIISDLREAFSFRETLLPDSRELFSQIVATVSVCVNIRRTDFLQNRFHPLCGMQYFSSAIQKMKSQLMNPTFFIFSDDKEWCNIQFRHMENIVLVGDEHDGKKYGNKLQLMSCCKHFIIPNSSYAWWAAWLGNHKNKMVIAPQKWFNDPGYNTKDLLPTGWISFQNEDER